MSIRPSRLLPGAKRPTTVTREFYGELERVPVKFPILICCVGKCQNRKQIMVPYMVSKQFRQSPRVVSAGERLFIMTIALFVFCFCASSFKIRVRFEHKFIQHLMHKPAPWAATYGMKTFGRASRGLWSRWKAVVHIWRMNFGEKWLDNDWMRMCWRLSWTISLAFLGLYT